MSNTTIVLNKEAMNALFPEGSEARLQLATSAIKAFAESSIKPAMISDKILAIIDEQRKAVTHEVLKELGVTASWGGTSFRQDFLDKLKNEAANSVSAAITASIKPMVERAQAQLQEQIERTLQSRMQSDVNKMVSAAVSNAVNATLALKPTTV